MKEPPAPDLEVDEFETDMTRPSPSTVTDEGLVERVAAAIFDDYPQWHRFPPEYREAHLRKAELALEAMRTYQAEQRNG